MFIQREKQIFCGSEYKEVDIIGAVSGRRDTGRSRKKSISTPAQKNLNDKKARRYFVQLVNCNFVDFRDWLLHLTYDDEHLPSTVEEAEERCKRFIRRLNYRLKKQGLKNAKYIIITTDTSTKSGKLVRVHHHIILSCELSRGEILKLWNEGRKNLDELQGDKDKYHKLCEYLKKNMRSGRRWTSSLNLKKPQLKINDNKYTGRQIEKIAKAPVDIDFWERRYPGWTLINADNAYQVEYNELTGWSIYLKMRRKSSQKSKGDPKSPRL